MFNTVNKEGEVMDSREHQGFTSELSLCTPYSRMTTQGSTGALEAKVKSVMWRGRLDPIPLAMEKPYHYDP